MCFIIISIGGSFNPRSRTGSDLTRVILYCILKVSIHAPARGATVGVLDAFSERVLEGGIENPQNLTFSFVMFV